MNDAKIAKLRQSLTAPHWLTRADAVKEALALGQEGLPLLLPLLQDEHWMVRERVAKGCAQLSYPEATPALLQALEDSYDSVRLSVIDALGKIADQRALEPLLRLLQDRDDNIRLQVAQALHHFEQPGMVPSLIPALLDRDERVRQSVRELLVRLGASALPSLQAAISTAPPELYHQLIATLCQIQPEGVEFLIGQGQPAIEALLEIFLSEDTVASQDIINTLVKIGAPVVPLVLERLAQGHKAVAPILIDLGSLVCQQLARMLPEAEAELDQEIIKILLQIEPQGLESITAIGDQAVIPLIQTLNESTALLRRNAAVALGNLRDFRAVDFLIGTLGDDEWQVRVAAAQALVQIGSMAVYPLVRVLRSPNSAFRLRASETLVQIGDEEAVDFLIQCLGEKIPEVRARAAVALGKIDHELGVVPLMRALQDTSPWVRLEAARALGRIANQRAVLQLTWSLRDEHEDVSEMAAQALSLIGKPAISPLLKLIHDKDPQIRVKAAAILGNVGQGETQVIQALIAMLHEQDPPPLAAIQALGKIGGPAAIPSLLPFANYKDEHYRLAFIQALEKIGGSQVVEALLPLLKDKVWQVRAQAACTLGKIADQRAIVPLLRLLKDQVWLVRTRGIQALSNIGPAALKPLLQALPKDKKMRACICEALGLIGDPQALDQLVGSIRDQEVAVRSSAVWALGQFRDPQAISALIEALEDPEDQVRFNAATALGRIADPQAIDPLVRHARKEPNVLIKTQMEEAVARMRCPPVPGPV